MKLREKTKTTRSSAVMWLYSAFCAAVCQIQIVLFWGFVFVCFFKSKWCCMHMLLIFGFRCNTSKHPNPVRRPEDIQSSSRQNIQVSQVVLNYEMFLMPLSFLWFSVCLICFCRMKSSNKVLWIWNLWTFISPNLCFYFCVLFFHFFNTLPGWNPEISYFWQNTCI